MGGQIGGSGFGKISDMKGQNRMRGNQVQSLALQDLTGFENLSGLMHKVIQLCT